MDGDARVVWGCLPRFDGDPTFCALLDTPASGEEQGIFSIGLIDHERSEQVYDSNTPIVVTRLYDRTGGGIEIIDCAPRFVHHGRIFHPAVLVRRVRPLGGAPSVVVRLRPACRYGSEVPNVAVANGHISYFSPELNLRLTTDASVSAIVEERAFLVVGEFSLLLGPDESVTGLLSDVTSLLIKETRVFWRDWVRRIAVPFEWQDTVIRTALTLQQGAFDDTGAIVAAMTTSIPDGPSASRHWDCRHVSVGDCCFVVDALNALSANETMEHFLEYIVNLIAAVGHDPMHPIYRLNGAAPLHEQVISSLPGYRGVGPVQASNNVSKYPQHDVYGSAILAAAHAFFDERLVLQGGSTLFAQLEALGLRAVQVFDKPEPGLWAPGGGLAIHTFSSVMCWVACDRLAKIAARLGLGDRERAWRTGRRQNRKIRP